MMAALAFTALTVWAVLLLGRGGFWLCRERDDGWPARLSAGAHWPEIVAIVPARDEAQVIERSLGALLAQDYAGRLRIVLVDDDSSDGTAKLASAMAERLGRRDDLTILTNRAVPAGWTGKLWAMRNGLAFAEALDAPPSLVLFCDADIALAPDTLTRLAAMAINERRVLVSLMARLSVETPAEKALIPAFVYFFAQLYPFAWVGDPAMRTAAAAGGCMLVDRAALQRAGGLESIRGAIIDDCALGRLLKTQGPIRLALTRRAVSLRVYATLHPIRRMVTRSAYAELKYSPARLAIALTGLALTYLLPPLALFFGEGLARWLGLAGYVAMMASFLPILRFYGLPLVLAATLPLVALLYGAFTLESALLHWRGRGGAWKGRYQGSPRPGDAA